MPPTHVAQGWTIASGDSLTQIKIGDEGYSMAITLNGRGLHLLHVPPGVSLDARAGAVRRICPPPSPAFQALGGCQGSRCSQRSNRTVCRKVVGRDGKAPGQRMECTTMTGQQANATTFCATRPSSKPVKRPCPRPPMTIKSACPALTEARISAAGSPMNTSVEIRRAPRAATRSRAPLVRRELNR